jgi:ATP/ADP translocase
MVMEKRFSFVDVRAGEGLRVSLMASLLFLLIAANNLIKILRDSIFLGHHSVSELPYLYILVAFLAGAIIVFYTRYTIKLSTVRLILGTSVIILSNMIFFWVLLTYFNAGWSHYAFYIWSAIANVIAVAQSWTLANHIFTPEEGRRSFGIVTAGGTMGGVAASLVVKGWIHLSIDSSHLLWIAAGLYIAAAALVFWAERRLKEKISDRELRVAETTEKGQVTRIGELIAGSPYLKTIAVIILVSVIVSTLIDFQLKTSAKQAYTSTRALASFFSTYYGWLSVATFFVQVVLTGKALNKFGLGPSLYLTPAILLAGSLAIMIWPIIPVAVLIRMADATLRNSVHRSGMEIIYMALPARVVKAVKTFLDVVIERVGDAAAGLTILLVSSLSGNGYIARVHLVCIGLLFAWIFLIPTLRIGYAHAGRSSGLISPPVWPAGDSTKKTLDL